MMQTWLERLIRFQQNYHKLMQGRYAKFDQLNRGLLIAALVFSLLSRWLPYRIEIVILFLSARIVIKSSVHRNEKDEYV